VPGYGEMFGGKAPALIWHDFMGTAVAGHCEPFPTPTDAFISQPYTSSYTVAAAPAYTGPFTPDKNGDKKKRPKNEASPVPPSGDQGGRYPPQDGTHPAQPQDGTSTTPSPDQIPPPPEPNAPATGGVGAPPGQ
jgi:membrane peptidoglycan carboxypeptidase